MGLKYARGVQDGSIPACKFVKQAVERQLRDLETFNTAHPLYFWDEAAASKVCRYIERLPHVKGPKAKEGDGLIDLEPWQCFILTTVFGWRRKDTGGRRFRRVYIEVPRGNAKSTMSSGVGLYGMTADEEVGADVYSAATKREQAKIVFGDARAMMIKRADFASKLGVVVNLAALTQPKSNSKFEPLSRDYGTMDGLNIHIALIDELHAHKDRGIYDVIETGAAKRLNSLLWAITTAGVDTSGICYEQRTYVSRILNQAIEDESYFGIIYTIDEDDDWTDPKAWVKANPNWGVSVMPEVIGQLATKAMQTPSAQANFKTKHLDVWCQANNPAFDLEAWERCTDDSLVEEDFTLDPCVFGIDIATKTDIASFVRLYERDLPKYAPGCESHSVRGQWECKTCYPDESDKEKHYYLFATNWLPEAAVYDGRNSQYQGWALEGHLTETPGEVLDFSLVKQEILDRAALVVLKGACYDPWQMAAVAQDLEKDGLPMIEVRATVANFSAPMKELMALVISQRLHHPGSPAMKWMFSNVVGHFDVKDNIYPRKEKPENKIDAAVATIMALYHMLLQQSGPYTADRGLLTL